jgi:hypothetical protein
LSTSAGPPHADSVANNFGNSSVTTGGTVMIGEQGIERGLDPIRTRLLRPFGLDDLHHRSLRRV